MGQYVSEATRGSFERVQPLTHCSGFGIDYGLEVGCLEGCFEID